MPMDVLSADFIEIASEILIHYTFLSFVVSEMQFSPVSKYNAGWGSVVLISLLVSMHVIYMCYELTQTCIKETKTYWKSFNEWRTFTPFDYATRDDLSMLKRFEEETNKIRASQNKRR